jgi:hypothetical protein
MAMQKKTWMNFFLFKEFLSFFKQSIPSGVVVTNQHLLILNGHGSHVTIRALKQAHEFGLDMISLPAHTSHALQPLDFFALNHLKLHFQRLRMQ